MSLFLHGHKSVQSGLNYDLNQLVEVIFFGGIYQNKCARRLLDLKHDYSTVLKK